MSRVVGVVDVVDAGAPRSNSSGKDGIGFAFASPMIGADAREVNHQPARTGRAQRGLVVGRRFAGAFGSGFTVAFAFACVPLFGAAFFFAAGVFPVVATAPEETRAECLVRCRVFFGV